MKKKTTAKKTPISKRKKKILAIVHYYITDNRGGGEVMLHELLKSLVNAGYEVDAIVTLSNGETVVVDGVTVLRGREHLENIQNKDYDLFVTHFNEADFALSHARLRGIPTVYIAHNDMEPTKLTLMKSRPSLTVFNTQWIKDAHNYDGNSLIIHPPVYAKDHATERGEHITLVNLIQSKGAHMMYNLAALMPRQRFMGVKGGYYKGQQIVIPRNNVKIIENTDNMKRDVWSNTKILLMPSEYESYGMAAVEALASGIPVIAHDTPGLRESLSYAGIFQENFQLHRWKHAVQLLQDPERYAQASELSLKRSAEIRPEIELKLFVKEVEKLL